MAAVDRIADDVQRLFDAKKERRRRLAALPFEEKTRIVVALQRMAAPLRAQRHRRARVWEIEDRG